jgi:RIO-like serine/threonine protein kinase
MPTLTLDPLGPVVVKRYRRGGWLGRFNRRHYLNLHRGATRSEKEYTWLNRARALGINAPKPLVAAHQGTWVYRCWLVTQAVVGATSLAQLSVERPAGIDKVCAACACQIDILVENRMLHPDLHPGNVLVDPDGQSWLIDFDKTRHYRGRRQRLNERYRQRWTRAVLKYGLPPALGAVFQQSRNGWQA